MANFKFEWWYLIPIIAIIAIFGPGWFEMATLGHHSSMAECTEDLAETKVSYPEGYYPDSCVIGTQTMADCITRELGSDTLQDDVGDILSYWDTTGNMDATEMTKYDCIHSPQCDTTWKLDNHGRCCSTNQAQVENVRAHYSSTKTCQMFFYPETLRCVECVGSGGGGTTCRTSADLAPCDGKVNWTEFTSFAQSWLSGSKTWAQFVEVAQAWVNG